MLRYSDLHESFPEAYLAGVYGALSVHAHSVCKAAAEYASQKKVGVSLRVNGRDLYDVVVSSYYDIMRFKEFHLANRAGKFSDGVKRAAYFTKWILKFRPIEYKLDNEEPDEDRHDSFIQVLNEHLALEWALSCVGSDCNYSSVSAKNGFRDDMIYAFHYRVLSVDGLLAMYKMISDTMKSGAASPLFESRPFSIASA